MSNARRVIQPGEMGGAVRVGALERTLEGFNSEMGQKMAVAFAAYQRIYVEPLAARVAWLELPLYRRAWFHARRFWDWLAGRLVWKEAGE